MRLLAGALLAIGLLGCNGIGPNRPLVETKAYALTQADEKIIQGVVRGSLPDPNSATFSLLTASIDASHTIYVCGRVNSIKLGGYTGFDPFIGEYVPSVDGGAFSLTGIGFKMDSMDMAVMDLCKQHGVYF